MRNLALLPCSLILLLLCLLSAFPAQGGSGAEEVGRLIKSGEKKLLSWRVREAADDAYKALELASGAREEHAARLLASRVEYHRGNYSEALRYAEDALSLKPQAAQEEPDDFSSYLQYIRKAAQTGGSFKEESSAHFILRFVHPKDRALVGYALEALERSYEGIGGDLGIYPREPVIVEVYPTLKSFTHASTLSREDIQTIGVVGVCNFNRIMVLSPRLLPKGYPWIDTLAHEFTHYLVFIGSHNGVPVWLHEGIAKYEEGRWKESERRALGPFYETLLAKALDRDELVPIEKMHPSFGKLDSSYEAQLAFAQVGSMVDFLVRRWGEGALPRLVDGIREEGDIDAAFRSVTTLDLKGFKEAWEGNLRKVGLRVRIPNAAAKELEFVEGEEAKEGFLSELADIESTEARDYALLGDLLGARRRYKAAAYEYEKALQFSPTSPEIANRLASARNSLGMYGEALEALSPIVELHPDYFNSYLNMGVSHLNRGELVKAKDSFEAALSINPFHPDVHASLISIYEALGMTRRLESQRRVLSIILGEAGQ